LTPEINIPIHKGRQSVINNPYVYAADYVAIYYFCLLSFCRSHFITLNISHHEAISNKIFLPFFSFSL